MDGDRIILTPYSDTSEPPARLVYVGLQGGLSGWHSYEYKGNAMQVVTEGWPVADSDIAYQYRGFIPMQI